MLTAWIPRRELSRMTIVLSALALVFGLSLVARPALATVMRYADLARLVEISDIIVQGTVAEQKTYFDKAQGRVVTDTTFAVARAFSGKVKERVTIQQWGGTHEGVTHMIAGDARFEKGEEVVVFLHRGGDGVIALSALGQSKFSIVRTSSGKIVSRDFSDISIMVENMASKPGAPTGDAAQAGAPGQIVHVPTETRELGAFSAELESLVAGIKGGSRE